LDSALASGLAVAGAGPVCIPRRTLGNECHSSPIGNGIWFPNFMSALPPKADMCAALGDVR